MVYIKGLYIRRKNTFFSHFTHFKSDRTRKVLGPGSSCRVPGLNFLKIPLVLPILDCCEATLAFELLSCDDNGKSNFLVEYLVRDHVALVFLNCVCVSINLF